MERCIGCGVYYSRVEQHQGFCSLYKQTIRDSGKKRGRKEAQTEAAIYLKRQRDEWQKETDAKLLKKQLEMLQEQLVKKDEEIDKLAKANKEISHDFINHLKTVSTTQRITINNIAINHIPSIIQSFKPFVYEYIKNLQVEELKALKPTEFCKNIENYCNNAITSIEDDDSKVDLTELKKRIKETTKDLMIELKQQHPVVSEKAVEIYDYFDKIE